MNHPSYSSRLFDEIILKSWWVIIFFLICFFIYDQGMQRKNLEQRKLYDKLLKVQNETAKAIEDQEDLKLELQSHNDPAWIELVLMRKLGLVPEGQIKVYFKESGSSP